MTYKAKCAGCCLVQSVDDRAKKFCCSDCGILNTPQRDTAGTGDQACGCLLPKCFEWRLPVGGISPVNGDRIYTTADDATPLTRIEWVACFGYDPEIVLAKMRKLGKEGVEGFYNTSTLGKKGAK